jgi:hypothetical protein
MPVTALEPQRATPSAPVQPPAPPQGPQPLDPQALGQVSGGAKGGKPPGLDGWAWN